MPTEFVFTEARVRDLQPPATGREYHKDKKVRGLQVCITAAGTATYYFVRRIDGKPSRVKIGRVEEWSLSDARDRANELAGDISRGRNPIAEARVRREQPTLQDLFDHWLQHARQHKRTWPEDERQYRAFLKRWSGRRLGSIKKADVQALHAKLGQKNGIYAANRLIALLRAMFNKADDIGWTGANPAAGIKKFREQSRDRFLQPDELRAFFQALDEEAGLFRDYFLLCLFTGARRSNVAAMRWQDIDLGLGYWRIPDTQSGEPVVVPLVEPAARVLQTRRLAADGSPWVFPTRSKTGHLMEPKVAWRRICKAAGLEDLRIHDLRRSLGSWQATGGTSLPIIGRMLGHKQTSSTSIYARLCLDPVRESAADATARMLLAGGRTADGKVIEEKGKVDDKTA